MDIDVSVYSIAWQTWRYLLCTASNGYIVNPYTSASMAATDSERRVMPLAWQTQESAAFILQPQSHERKHQPAQHSTSSVHYLLSIILHKTPTVSISPPDQNHHASSPHVPPSRPLQQQRRQRPLRDCWHAARRPPSPSNIA
jgi:hypothetical protein